MKYTVPRPNELKSDNNILNHLQRQISWDIQVQEHILLQNRVEAILMHDILVSLIEKELIPDDYPYTGITKETRLQHIANTILETIEEGVTYLELKTKVLSSNVYADSVLDTIVGGLYLNNGTSCIEFKYLPNNIILLDVNLVLQPQQTTDIINAVLKRDITLISLQTLNPNLL